MIDFSPLPIAVAITGAATWAITSTYYRARHRATNADNKGLRLQVDGLLNRLRKYEVEEANAAPNLTLVYRGAHRRVRRVG